MDDPASPDGDRQPVAFLALAICPYCDAVYHRQKLHHVDLATCLRCGADLGRGHRVGPHALLALSLAALIAFVLANSYPFLTLDARGVRSASTLWGAIVTAWQDQERGVAIIVGVTLFLCPLASLLLRIHVLLAVVRGRRPAAVGFAMRALHFVVRWSMVEVFVLGVCISIAKIGALAIVVPDIGTWAFAAMTVLVAAIGAIDLERLWDFIPERDPVAE